MLHRKLNVYVYNFTNIKNFTNINTNINNKDVFNDYNFTNINNKDVYNVWAEYYHWRSPVAIIK